MSRSVLAGFRCECATDGGSADAECQGDGVETSPLPAQGAGKFDAFGNHDFCEGTECDATFAKRYSDNDRSVDIRFPEWHQWTEIYSESRIDHGFDTLWSALSPEVQTTLMDGFGESEWATTKMSSPTPTSCRPSIGNAKTTSSSRDPSKYSSATRHAIEINRNETHATPPTKPERNSDRVNAQNLPDVSPTSAI